MGFDNAVSTEQMEAGMQAFRKRPVQIMAKRIEHDMQIETPEGVMTGNRGDMLVKGVAGEFYPVKSDIFEMTYESVSQPDTGIILECYKCKGEWPKADLVYVNEDQAWFCPDCLAG